MTDFDIEHARLAMCCDPDDMCETCAELLAACDEIERLRSELTKANALALGYAMNAEISHKQRDSLAKRVEGLSALLLKDWDDGGCKHKWGQWVVCAPHPAERTCKKCKKQEVEKT